MASAGPVSTVISFDGVAGAELVELEAWVLEWFKVNAKAHFDTIDRWRGQLTAKDVERVSFAAPALYVSCVGSDGRAQTSGGSTIPGIRFSAVVVTKNKGAERSSRYLEGLAKASIMYRLLHCMEPPFGSSAKRANAIGFKNSYSSAFDRMGLSVFDFTWVHELRIGDINVDCLADFATISGQLFPNDPTHTTLPTEGEVTLESE